MANSKLLLYVSNLTPEKNALISDPTVTANSNKEFERFDIPFVISFGTNMGWFQKTVASSRENDYLLIPEFTYIKHDLDVKIKVVLNQEDRLSKNVKAYNYVLIENEDEPCYGYFITDKKWISEHCVEYTLRMDVLNSYSTQIQTDRSTFSDSSYIYRTHQDRYWGDGGNKNKYLDPEQDAQLYREVNDISEGIDTPKFIRINSETINENDRYNNQNYHWYLVYMTESEGSGVSCYVYPEIDIPFAEGGADLSVSRDSLDGRTFVFMPNWDDNIGVTVDATESYPNDGRQHTWTINSTTVIAISPRSSSGVTVHIGDIGTSGDITWDSASAGGYSCYDGVVVHAPYAYRVVTYQSGNIKNYIDNVYQIKDVFTRITVGGGGLVYATSIDNLDRTDSRLIKIIELPYAPFNINKLGNHYIVPSGFTFNDNRLKLDDLNTQFSNGTLNTVDLTPMLLLTDSAGGNNPSRYTKKKDIKYESKLLNSDFRQDKFVYDSFSKQIRYEALEEPSYYNTATNRRIWADPTFYPSSNISSDSLFKFDFYTFPSPTILSWALTYKHVEDYELYLTTSRNNEYPIYNNDYLNYIKTGYNYDKKNKEQQQVASGVGLGVSAAALIAGIALSGATGGSSLALGVSGAIGLAGSTMNAVNQSISAERSLEQKLNDLKAKSASVINADDLSLLNVYNGNKLQWMQYEPTDQVKNSLWNMFHLTGYAYNKEGNIADFIYSRRCFNFIQADLKDGLRSASIPTDEIKDEIKNKFKEGVTVYHIFYNGTSEIIDWSKEYENFENYVCPAKQPIIIG